MFCQQLRYLIKHGSQKKISIIEKIRQTLQIFRGIVSKSYFKRETALH